MDSENCVKLVESWKAGGGVLTVDGTQLTAVLADWLAGWLTGATLGRFNNGARFTHDDTRVLPAACRPFNRPRLEIIEFSLIEITTVEHDDLSPNPNI